MKKYIIFGLVIVAAFSVGAVLAAKPDFQAAKIANPVTGKAKNTVVIPAKAIEVAPNIFYLGAAMDKDRKVEGYAFVDYKKGFGKPSGCNNDGVCQGWESPSCADCASSGATSSCYSFLSKGAKWKTSEPYLVSTATPLDELFIKDNIAFDISKWEDAADGKVDGIITKNILGDRIEGVIDGADMIQPDNKNEVYFGNIEKQEAIAITIVWGIFTGRPSQRELVEWDQVYDDVDFAWSSNGEANKMDFENIATHELGHSVGLDDLYESACSDQTMYGYADYGEIIKRTLEAGDITGVKELYK